MHLFKIIGGFISSWRVMGKKIQSRKTTWDIEKRNIANIINVNAFKLTDAHQGVVGTGVDSTHKIKKLI